MKFDVSELSNRELNTEELNMVLKEDNFYDGNEYINILEPIRFSGTLKKVGDIFILDGKVNTVLELICSRCLSKFAYTVNINIKDQFTDRRIINEGDEDITFIDNNCIDITEVLENDIILILPIKRLCREDCKGLCHKCGANLNIAACNCHKDEIDPRWEELKNIFSTD
ncbi:YceD family protein [Clostridium sp. LBM24168]